MWPTLEAIREKKLVGLTVFIVEDEALVALNLEDMLFELGCRVLGPAMRFEQAEKMVAGDLAIDAAVLDVNIGGRQVFPLAETLRARKVPIVFATGYGRGGIPEAWHDCPILQKPYTISDLARSLAGVFGDIGRSSP